MAIIKQPYPFDPQDQLDFEWEFQFASGDTDAVASYSLEPDAGLLVVADSLDGNIVTGWIKVDPDNLPADLSVLGVTCHMEGSTTPPRKMDATILLQIRRR